MQWARMLNWRCFYIPDWFYRLAMSSMKRMRRGDRDWPDKGFPDLVLVKPPRIIFAELKAPNGRISPEQAQWHDALRACGLNVYVWKPADMDDIILLLSSP